MDHLLLSFDDFVLSSGTVPVDVSKGLVLLLYYRSVAMYVLPKVRKNVGETTEAAAVRATWKESGFDCHLYRHQLHTNAQELRDSHHTEPIAVQQRMDYGIREIISWYICEVDSCSQRMAVTQEVGEEFDVVWVSMKHAPSVCTFADERRVVEIALEAVPRTLLVPLPGMQGLADPCLF